MWLKGSSDIDNFQQDVYDLLTGTIVAGSRGGGQAGNGAQVAGSDIWTGIDAGDFIVRTQKTESPFSGEYTLRRGIPRFAARSTSTVISNIGNPTFSGAYVLGTARVWFSLFVSTTNTSPGNLTGTVVTYDVRNADTNVSVASGTVTGWSGSTDTRTIGATGISISLTLGGSDQFIAGANAILWMRAYGTAYAQGVDYFPEAVKVTGGITVSNSPGGSNNYSGGGVDYTLVQEVTAFPTAVAGGATAPFSSAIDWGGNGAASGIAWNAGGSPPAVGATYYVPDTYLVFGPAFQVPNVVSIGGNFSLTGAPMDAWDSTLGNGRWVMTNTTSVTTPKTTVNTTESNGRIFTGAAQAGTTFINFWISVKQDKIVMVFRGDPGQSGLTVIMTLQRATPITSPNTDDWPWVFICTTPDSAADGWMSYYVRDKTIYDNPYYGVPSLTLSQLVMSMWWQPPSGNAGRFLISGIATASLPDQNPNNWNLRWFIYSIYGFGNQGGSNLVGTFDSTKQMAIRQRLQGVYSLADDNFTHLDELVDNSGTYLLVIPTSTFGQGTGAQQYTAIAVLEE